MFATFVDDDPNDIPIRLFHSLYNYEELILIAQRLYIRNTRKGVKAELPPLKYKELVIRLQFTEVERAYYDEHLYYVPEVNEKNCLWDCYVKLRQLCCHPQVSKDWAKVLGSSICTIEKLRDKMINFKLDIIDEKTKKRNKCNQRIDTYQRELNQLERKNKLTKEERRRRDELTIKIPHKKEKSEVLQEEISGLQKQLEYFNTVVATLEDPKTEKTCAICFEPVVQAAVTPCGHYYCKKCYKSFSTEQQKKCQLCRQLTPASSILYVTLDAVGNNNANPESSKYFNKALVTKYGTKPSALVEYINHTLLKFPDSHFIVFSQWDDLLHMIGIILSENSINNLFCEGAVGRKVKALNEFNSGDIRVLMLSLKNSASGTNLQKADHVILLDVVAGSKLAVRAKETQAIGRVLRQGQEKSITVVRFIMEDTIESMIHNINVSTGDDDDYDKDIIEGENNDDNENNDYEKYDYDDDDT